MVEWLHANIADVSGCMVEWLRRFATSQPGAIGPILHRTINRWSFTMTLVEQFKEPVVYLGCVPSGWRIERPSGSAIVRALGSREDALAYLAGYTFQGMNRSYERWSRK